MHADHLAGMHDGDIQTFAVMLGKLTRQQLAVPHQRYGNAEFPGSGDRTVNFHDGSIVATHCVYRDSHTLLPDQCVSESIKWEIKGRRP